MRPTYHQWKSSELKEVERLLREESARAVGVRFGVSEGAIKRLLERGLVSRDAVRRSEVAA